jgi:hypothetical protein
MAAPLQIHGRTYPQEPASFALNKATPPEKQIQKRKRSSTPFDQLRFEDEAEHLNQEAKAEERIDAADGDFSSRTLVEAHDQHPRRSTRQKLGEA